MYVLLDIDEYVIINPTSHQAWLFYPSVESRFRDALTFLTSSSLRPTGLPTGGTERVLALPAIAGWLRISGMKRVRIFGTDKNVSNCVQA